MQNEWSAENVEEPSLAGSRNTSLAQSNDSSPQSVDTVQPAAGMHRPAPVRPLRRTHVRLAGQGSSSAPSLAIAQVSQHVPSERQKPPGQLSASAGSHAGRHVSAPSTPRSAHTQPSTQSSSRAHGQARSPSAGERGTHATSTIVATEASASAREREAGTLRRPPTT